jgi:hypothetical protein
VTFGKASNITNVINAARTAPAERRKALTAESRLLFIRAVRAKGWTVARTAEECGSSPDAVEKWLSGKRRIPGMALVAVGAVANTQICGCVVELKAADRKAA